MIGYEKLSDSEQEGNRVSRIDDVIADVDYIRDTLAAYRNIIRTGCCHNCGIAKECVVKPKWGEMVRYNCPLYVSKEDCE